MLTKPTSPPERAAQARQGYSSVQIALHWLMVTLVGANWLLGDAMEEAFDSRVDGEDVADAGLAILHVAIGVSILLLMLVRLTIRVRRPVRTDPNDPHPILARLGAVNQLAFYVLLIVVPLAGAVARFGRSEDAGDLHETLVTVTLLLVLLHIAAALFHQFVLRDGLIRRMLRPDRGP